MDRTAGPRWPADAALRCVALHAILLIYQSELTTARNSMQHQHAGEAGDDGAVGVWTVRYVLYVRAIEWPCSAGPTPLLLL